jgi:hypothetical protein
MVIKFLKKLEKTNRLICWEQEDFNEYLKSNGFTPPSMFEPDTDDDEAFD